MAEAILDIVEGAFKWDANGPSQIRTFRVHGLDGPISRRAYDATLVSGVPRRFQRHETIPELVCLTVVSNIVDTDIVDVVCEFATPSASDAEPSVTGPLQISIDSTVTEVDTELDVNGNPITVDWQPPTPDGGVQPPVRTAAGTVRKRIANTVARFGRREPSASLAVALGAVGKVNSRRFLDRPPRSVFCLGVPSITYDGGISYDVEYLFEFSQENSFDPNVVYTENGERPDGVTATNGTRQVTVYEEFDFNALNVFV